MNSNKTTDSADSEVHVSSYEVREVNSMPYSNSICQITEVMVRL